MKIQILSKTDREIKFIVDGTNPPFANALRRAAMGEVPVLAIDAVDFLTNDSVLWDEVIAHRLALLPLVFDAKNYDLPGECKCEGKGCSRCQVVLALDKKGPATVFSKDLKSSADDVSPLFQDMPIAELTEGQKLKLEAIARLGIGRTHAKWQAARASYRYYPGAEVKGKITNPDAVVKACPKAALKMEDKTVAVTEDCDLCGECIKVAEPAGVLKMVGDPSKFIFNLESISGLPPEEIVLSACARLKAKAKEFEKQVGGLK